MDKPTDAFCEEGHPSRVFLPDVLTAENEDTFQERPTYADPEETVTEHPGHDGSDTFTIYLVISENVAVGFASIRDHALDLTGGSITRAKRFDRDATDKNRIWTLTMQPDGDADVVIALAPTTDCDDDGAICTSTGRRQSSELEYMVAGP